MLDRSRTVQVTLAAACLALLAVLAVAVDQRFDWLVDLDHRGDGAQEWAVDDAGLREVLRVIEDLFNTIGMIIWTAVLAVAMFIKNHRRAALFAVVVMLATWGATTAVKAMVGRLRPEWQTPIDVLDSGSFPSGHTSSIVAYTGIVLVLLSMLVRRRAIRQLLGNGMLLVAVVVALDRILLGRHYPTDVVGGALLGTAFVLLGLAFVNPQPRSHAVKAEPLSEVGPVSRRLHVILNPVKVEDVEAFQETVRGLASETGWQEPVWHLTTVEDSGTGQAEQAAVDGAELVIVCGGDGTVREVCAELAGTGIPVGIVPAGTGNLLARNLDIPLYLRAAIDIALTGQDRAIDMVAVRGDRAKADAHGEEVPEEDEFRSHFMVMAGLGFDAAIMDGVNPAIKEKVGWLAYVLSALKSLMYPVTKVEISIDGGEWTKHRARTIVVGNVGYLQAGMPLLPDAAIDDGELDVVMLYPRKFLSWIPLAFRVLAKRSRVDDTINRMTGRTVSIRASVETPRQLDGDSIGPGKELHMECIHGRLLVRVAR